MNLFGLRCEFSDFTFERISNFFCLGTKNDQYIKAKGTRHSNLTRLHKYQIPFSLISKDYGNLTTRSYCASKGAYDSGKLLLTTRSQVPRIDLNKIKAITPPNTSAKDKNQDFSGSTIPPITSSEISFSINEQSSRSQYEKVVFHHNLYGNLVPDVPKFNNQLKPINVSNFQLPQKLLTNFSVPKLKLFSTPRANLVNQENMLSCKMNIDSPKTDRTRICEYQYTEGETPIQTARYSVKNLKAWNAVNILILTASYDRYIQRNKCKIEDLTVEAQSIVFGSSIKKYDFKYLEKGSFGIVYKGIYKGTKVAIKVPNLVMIEVDPLGVIERVLREWRFLSRLKHPNIIEFKGGIILPNRHIWLITKLVNGPDLHSLRYRLHRNIPKDKALYMIRQLADVILFLHTPSKEKGIVIHRDIKPENLIVDTKTWRIYLCDFGDAEEYGVGNKKKLSGATWLYSPIELILTDPIRKDTSESKIVDYDEKWDIWSFGCILQEFFGYPNPFEYLVESTDSSNDIYKKLLDAAKKNRYIPYIPVEINSIIRNIILQCLNPDPKLRPNIKSVINTLKSFSDSQLMR
ncbi:protein kinase domain-containing protein [Cryptosporidium muris RN66]|uniref:Protein kinase domain-containing protein n=1 Tax=Cryptosporidium muris (strain RN66) TaxID=441375 RepID=B6AH54_CRYMR|nr:protein kinase domain-containing protein [Cryptosporidium muris RN66]EEA07545.1 protein kinase domain-containing protein [Cryptosporidium muris RN66]|eukprot:XP_002141894.1 protein kinase domain-containing protein [Cryptosporidium muris RN66]